jgi:peptidoglycan/xylan/chitin deacetylase (PgdA/CDA1 family)
MLEDYEFALCLTHDVDRPYKTFQAPYYAVKDQDLSHLKSLASSHRPYWQFEEIMELEEELGVRASFDFLNEKHLFRNKGPTDWIKPHNWKLYLGRYDITDDEIVDIIRAIDHRGWEVGLHGSYESYRDINRLQYEKQTLEDLLGREVIGGRQHYLNLKQPKTWEYHRDIGLWYDSSLGSSENYGFHHGYQPIRPFDDKFVIFPLTLMECAIMKTSDSIDQVKSECHYLLKEAKENNAVMTVLWHPRFFSSEFSNHREVYVDLVETAKEMGAWIGPCRDCYRMIVENN